MGDRICPKCRNEKAYFIGEVCGDCYAAGADLDAKAQQSAEAKMSKTYKECPYCHKMKSNVWEHKPHCKQRPGAGETDSGQRTEVRGQRSEVTGQGRRRKATGRMPKAPQADQRAQRAETPGEELVCQGCPWRRMNTAIARDLLTRALRGGMALEPACELIRQALQVE